MKKLVAYLRKYRKECVLGPLFKLLEACLELIVPLVMAKIIDTGVVNNAGSGYIWRMGALLAGMGLAGLAFSITAQYFAAKAACGFGAELRHALFERTQRLSRSQIKTMGAPTLIQRMTGDVNQVQSGLNLALRLLLRSPFVVMGAMIMAFVVDARCALIFLAVIPALAAVVAGIMAITMPMHKQARKRLDGVLSATRENLTGARVIRAFNLQTQEIQSFRQKNDALTSLSRLSGRISALMNPLTYVLVNLALVALLRTGAVRVDVGGITQGELVALVNYLSQILVELVKLADLIVSISRALACAERIQSVLSVEPDLLDPVQVPNASADDCAVRFDHVSMRYPGAAADTLTDISFAVGKGEMMGIIGGTGAGKSTLVELIPRFYDVTGGEVSVLGRDVRAWNRAELRKHIGNVPQKARLFSGTIRENLCYGRENATEAELRAALEAAQALDVVASKAEGLDAPVAQGGANFSGGQRQRLTIARALVGRPDILILDDSASALDFATEARLRQAIRQLDFHPTTFVVSQRISSVRNADVIAVLDDGHLVGLGTNDALMESCQVYREICASQEGGEAK